jgi:hypothetical protein
MATTKKRAAKATTRPRVVKVAKETLKDLAPATRGPSVKGGAVLALSRACKAGGLVPPTFETC